MKRQLKQHVMNATEEALDQRFVALEQQGAGLQRRIDDLEAGVIAIRELLATHLPRPDGRPEFLSQYHLSDVLAWRAAQTSAEFVEQHMSNALTMASRRLNLEHAARHAPQHGVVLEFGVGSGESLRWLEDLLPERRVVGFDSFEGLPEHWRPGFDAGAFSEVELSPPTRAELQIGLFEKTLPPFLETLDEPVALLHVDCDLYSSTRTVLQHCMPRLAPGAVVVFDEFFNYPGWQEHEAKAWHEYLTQTPTSVTYLSYVPSWEQIAVRVEGR